MKRVESVWLERVRLRVLAVVAACSLCLIGLLAWSAMPILSLVSVTAVTVIAVHGITSKVRDTRCYACASDLAGKPGGAYGVVCPRCGAINQQVPRHRA